MKLQLQDQICFHANLHDSLNDKKARLIKNNTLSTDRHKTIQGHSKQTEHSHQLVLSNDQQTKLHGVQCNRNPLKLEYIERAKCEAAKFQNTHNEQVSVCFIKPKDSSDELLGVHLHSSNRSNCVPKNFKWVNFKKPADDPNNHRTLTSDAFTSKGYYPFCFNYDKGTFEFEREGRMPFNSNKFQSWHADLNRNDYYGPTLNLERNPLRTGDGGCSQYAVIISGGLDEHNNREDYFKNVTTYANFLLDSGYSTIVIFYAGDDALAHMQEFFAKEDSVDVRGAVKDDISKTIQELCKELSDAQSEKKGFSVFITNHGIKNESDASNSSIPMWKTDTVYSAEDLYADLEHCNNPDIQLLGVFDQCFSGGFVQQFAIDSCEMRPDKDECTYRRRNNYCTWQEPSGGRRGKCVPTEGAVSFIQHGNFFSSTSESQPSYDREYCANLEDPESGWHGQTNLCSTDGDELCRSCNNSSEQCNVFSKLHCVAAGTSLGINTKYPQNVDDIYKYNCTSKYTGVPPAKKADGSEVGGDDNRLISNAQHTGSFEGSVNVCG